MKLTPEQLEFVLNKYRSMHYSELNSADFMFLLDNIDSLREIYSQIKYNDLTEFDKKILREIWVFNWYGWAGTNPIIKFLIGLICYNFKEVNSEKHDYWFWIGWDINKFHECNTKLYFAIEKDALTLNWWEKYIFLVVWLLAYLAIEFLWKKYFYFRNKSV